MHSVAKQKTFYFPLPLREAVVRHHFISNPISSKHKTDLSFYIFLKNIFSSWIQLQRAPLLCFAMEMLVFLRNLTKYIFHFSISIPKTNINRIYRIQWIPNWKFFFPPDSNNYLLKFSGKGLYENHILVVIRISQLSRLLLNLLWEK